MKAWLAQKRFTFIDAIAMVFSALASHERNWILFATIVAVCAFVSVYVERTAKTEVDDG